MKNLANKTAMGVAWQASGAVLRAVVQLVVIAVLARHLTPEDFGLFALASVVLSFADILTNYSGFAQAVVQRPDVRDAHIYAANYLALGMGALVFLVMWAGAPLLAILLGNPAAGEVIRTLSPLPLASSFGAVALGLAYRQMNVKVVSMINVAAYCVGFGVVGITLALKGYGVLALVGAALAEALVRALALNLIVRSDRFGRVSLAEVREIAGYSFGAISAQLINAAALNVDRVIVQYFFGTSMLGYYQMAHQIAKMPNRFIGDPLQRVMFAAFSRAQGEGEWPRRTLRSVTELVFLTFVPMTVILAVTSGEMIDIVLGPGWEMSATFVTILVLAIPLQNVNGVASAAIRANGAVYTATVLRLLMLAYITTACYVAARSGIEHVAGAVAVGAAVYFALSTFVLRNMGLARYVDVAKRVAVTYIAIGALFAAGLGLRTQFEATRLGDIYFLATYILMACALALAAIVVLRDRIAGIRYARSMLDGFIKRLRPDS